MRKAKDGNPEAKALHRVDVLAIYCLTVCTTVRPGFDPLAKPSSQVTSHPIEPSSLREAASGESLSETNAELKRWISDLKGLAMNAPS